MLIFADEHGALSFDDIHVLCCHGKGQMSVKKKPFIREEFNIMVWWACGSKEKNRKWNQILNKAHWEGNLKSFLR